MNQFEEAARARKVAAYVAYFDRRFTAIGRCPHHEADALAQILRDQMNEDQWKYHAVLAGQRPPRATTVALIIAVYEQRAAERVTEPPLRRCGGVH